MKKYMILTCVGKDRPGIVDDISTMLYEHNANIEDSRMAVMGGRFSVMILFSCTLAELERISTGMKELEPLGLKASQGIATETIGQKYGLIGIVGHRLYPAAQLLPQ